MSSEGFYILRYAEVSLHDFDVDKVSYNLVSLQGAHTKHKHIIMPTPIDIQQYFMIGAWAGVPAWIYNFRWYV